MSFPALNRHLKHDPGSFTEDWFSSVELRVRKWEHTRLLQAGHCFGFEVFTRKDFPSFFDGNKKIENIHHL